VRRGQHRDQLRQPAFRRQREIRQQVDGVAAGPVAGVDEAPGQTTILAQAFSTRSTPGARHMAGG
jgi:hypothetical protein